MNSILRAVLNVLVVLPLAIFFIIESLVLFVIPKRLRYKDVRNETVLITGAGSGIGRELAVRFAKLGSRLVLLDINLKGLKETASLLGNSAASLYECDVSNRQKVYEVASKIKDEVGRVTILINNAGIVSGKKFLECPDEMIQKTMDVNIMAHFWTCKAFLPDMISANHGHVVSVASVAGVVGIPKLTDYCASKFAAVGFEEALRLELFSEKITGVKTTVVQPYMVQTGLFDGLNISWLNGMSTEYVADRIMAGVLVDQEVIMIPGFLVLGAILLAVFPRKVSRIIMEALGISRCMENFRGRYKGE